MHNVRHPPRILACVGQHGVAWVIGTDASRECVVVDPHLAPEAVASVVRDGGRHVVASLGTSTVPESTEADRTYASLLGDLGLVPLTAPADLGIAIGPVPGWGGATVARVGNRVVELGVDGDGPLVVPSGLRGLQVTVTTLVVRFGPQVAIGSVAVGFPGTLNWRVGDHVFVASRDQPDPDHSVVHPTTTPSSPASATWGGHPVQVVDAWDRDLVSDVQILDISGNVDVVSGGRRVTPSLRPADLNLDPFRAVLLVSADGVACERPAERLARSGFQVMRIRGGAQSWRVEGLPFDSTRVHDTGELSIDAPLRAVVA